MLKKPNPMKVLSNLLICVSIILFSCGGNTVRQKSPEELRQELKMTEHQNFNQYLTVETKSADYKLWTNNYSITGSINSTASLARFKDAVLTVTFLSSTDTELKSVDFVIYKFLEPNSKTDFEIKTKIPSATKKYNVQIKIVVPID